MARRKFLSSQSRPGRAPDASARRPYRHRQASRGRLGEASLPTQPPSLGRLGEASLPAQPPSPGRLGEASLPASRQAPDASARRPYRRRQASRGTAALPSFFGNRFNPCRVVFYSVFTQGSSFLATLG